MRYSGGCILYALQAPGKHSANHPALPSHFPCSTHGDGATDIGFCRQGFGTVGNSSGRSQRPRARRTSQPSLTTLTLRLSYDQATYSAYTVGLTRSSGTLPFSGREQACIRGDILDPAVFQSTVSCGATSSIFGDSMDRPSPLAPGFALRATPLPRRQ